METSGMKVCFSIPACESRKLRAGFFVIRVSMPVFACDEPEPVRTSQSERFLINALLGRTAPPPSSENGGSRA